MKQVAVGAFVVAALSAGSAWPCDSSSCALLTRNQGGLLPRHAFRVDLSFRYTDEGARHRGSEPTDDVLRPKLFLENGLSIPAFHRELDGRESFLQLDVGYGLTDGTSLVASLPLQAWRSFDVQHVGLERRYSTSGVGDAVFGVRHAIGRVVKGVVGGIAIKTPTGRSRLAGDFDGSILDPTLQPGSGSFDVVTTLQAGRRALGLRWTAAGSYQWTTANGLAYRFGNGAVGTIGAGRSLGSRLSASLQAKVFHQGRSRFRGQDVASTGSTMVYVTPGLQLSLPRDASIYGFFQILPYRHVNDAQLAPRAALLVGISKWFAPASAHEEGDPMHGGDGHSHHGK